MEGFSSPITSIDHSPAAFKLVLGQQDGGLYMFDYGTSEKIMKGISKGLMSKLKATIREANESILDDALE